MALLFIVIAFLMHGTADVEAMDYIKLAMMYISFRVLLYWMMNG